ncbi:MAG: hypothetical protein LBO62_04055 [Endomicrobium sp.]|jgi:hypothetical protein|nr:hypothetical protein [Endomicrobium sp.]
MSKFLTLTQDLYLNEGGDKVVYRHPYDDSLCIKILKKTNFKLMEMRREICRFNQLHKKGVKINFAADFKGTVETNLGDGYVFELIKDFDGNSSLRMSDWLSDVSFVSKNFEILIEAFKNFKRILYENAVVFYDMKLENICLKRESPEKFSLVFVDNIKSGKTVPIEYFFKFYARSKLKRYWKRYIVSNILGFSKNPDVQKLACAIE